MGDRISATISIGGPLNHELLDEFVAAILRDGPEVGHDFDGGSADEDEYRGAIDEAVRGKTTLDLCDIEASYGQFDTIEAFCVNNELTFVRHHDSKYEYNAEHAWYTPGMDEAKSSTSDNDGNTLLDVDEIQECMKDGDCPTQIARLKALIEAKCPPVVPPLSLQK